MESTNESTIRLQLAKFILKATIHDIIYYSAYKFGTMWSSKRREKRKKKKKKELGSTCGYCLVDVKELGGKHVVRW